MNRNKLILIAILCIFVVGMVMAPASASHKIKVGKYKGKISNKYYKYLKKAKKGKYQCVVPAKCTNYKKHYIYVEYNPGTYDGYKHWKKGYYCSVLNLKTYNYVITDKYKKTI